MSKSDQSISRFFQPKPKPPRNEENVSKPEKENDVIVLDDDDDGDCSGLDSNDNVALIPNEESTAGILEGEPIQTQTGESLVIEIDDDEHDDDDQSSAVRREKMEPNASATEANNTESDSSNDSNPSDISMDAITQTDPDRITPTENSSPLHVRNDKENPFAKFVSLDAENENENPFAKFAFGASGASDSAIGRPVSTRLTWQMHSSASGNNKRNCTKMNNSENGGRISKKKNACAKQEKKKEKDFVKMKDIPPEEQTRIVRKWHSLADPSASLEVRRYQVLLAARLHARCQEPTVRKAMGNLHKHFATLPEPKQVTVDEVAQMEPELLASHISNLQFYNAKAKQIVKAAQELLERHGGVVPEDEFSLLQITGIGKTFADLLAFVNTREVHGRYI